MVSVGKCDSRVLTAGSAKSAALRDVYARRAVVFRAVPAGWAGKV
jgi:hypothetical protein